MRDAAIMKSTTFLLGGSIMFEEVAEGAKRIAGRVIVGGALGLVALAPLPASAQQKVAANVPAATSAWPATVAECQKIKDTAKSMQCTVEVGGAINRAETQRLNVGTQVANNDGSCIDIIKAKIAERKIDPQALSNYLQGRNPSHPDIGGGCKLLAKFTSTPN
jgi:hypothetical protein